jgi:hypothetical protein
MSFNPNLLRRRLPAFGAVARLDFCPRQPGAGFSGGRPALSAYFSGNSAAAIRQNPQIGRTNKHFPMLKAGV